MLNLKDKKRWKKFLVIGIILLMIPLGVLAFRVSNGTYDLWTKFDFGAANTNASSTTFLQRFIFGSQPVSQYSSASFIGRLGILEESSSNLGINITSPLSYAEVVRGSGGTTWEDDLDLIDDNLNLTSRIYYTENNNGFSGGTCYFYLNDSLLGNATSNSSGECVYGYDKTSDSVGFYNASSNYSFSGSYVSEINISSVEYNLVRYSVPNYLSNYTTRTTTQTYDVFQDGDIAKLNVSVLKINSSGSFSYSPANISINATDSTDKSYPETSYVEGYRLNQTGTGEYQTWVYVNKSHGTNYLRWRILVSDDDFSTYLATGLHTDVGVFECGDFVLDSPYEECDDGKQCGEFGTAGYSADCNDDSDCVGIGDETCKPRSGDLCSSTCYNEFCGNNIKDLNEVCDGSDLDGETCVSQGFASGTLACSASCSAFDTSDCRNNPPPSSCFPAGTKILMADGTEKNIEDVKVGDDILTYDYYNHVVTSAKALEMEYPLREGYYNIKLSNNKEVNVTDEHPFYVKRQDRSIGWASLNPAKTEEEVKGYSLDGVEITTLNLKDKLFDVKGNWINIESIDYYAGEIQTYNIYHLETYHTFYANDFLVHNKNGPSCRDECSVEGSLEKVCSSDSLLRVRECGDYDTDSCLEWSEPEYEDCSLMSGLQTGEVGVCENAQCVVQGDSCENECSLGDEERDCFNFYTARNRECGDFDNDACLEWSDWENNECGSDEECFEGFCLTEDRIYDLFGCRANWNCSEFSECRVDYTTQDVLEGKISDTGYKEKVCNDLNGCRHVKFEREECSVLIPVYAEITEWCLEDYVEIRERDTDELVSRIKREQVQEFKDLVRVDVSFILTEFSGYCSYCYDGIKNYDETGVDCGGPSCPDCVPIISFFDWLWWLILILWILFFVLLIILIYKDEKEKQTQKRTGFVSSFAEKFKSVFKSRETRERIKERKVRQRKVREKKVESGISNWFKKVFALPRITIKGKKKEKVAYRKPREVKPKPVVAKPKRGLRRIIIEYGEERKARKTRKKAEKVQRRKAKKQKRAKKVSKRKSGDRYSGFMRRIREWRKRGYYGTSKLESEVRKHKRK